VKGAAGRTRILYLLPTLGAGGTERQAMELVRHIDRTRFDPIVVTLYAPETVPIEIPPGDDPVLSLRKPLGKLGNLVALVRLVRMIRESRADILQSYLRTADLYLRVAGVLAGHRRILTSLRTRIGGFWSTPWQWTERLLWRASRLIISNSPAAAEEAHALLGIPRSRLRVIENGVDVQRFKPVTDPAPARRSLGLRPGGQLVGMVARYSPVKDHRTLLHAIGKLRAQGRWPAQAKVLLVGGTTYAEARAEVERTVAEEDLGSVVEVRGVTPEVERVYHALDVLVLPSRYEGFPNTVLEAMACGVPAIVSSAANAAGVVAEGETGWVFPAGDAVALAQAVERALRLAPTARRGIAKRCRARAVEGYALEVMVARYEQLYAEMMGKA
jgi:glycosyltransferase involved in cell wall biosynthesis